MCVYDSKANSAKFLAFFSFDSDENKRFPCGATPSFTLFSATYICSIDLNSAM